MKLKDSIFAKSKKQFLEKIENRIHRYKKLAEELGKNGALEQLFEGYPEKQKRYLGPFLEDADSLYITFKKAIERYQSIGMSMEVIDISNKGQDAVLEVQKQCPIYENKLDKKCGFKEKPCALLCQMDIDATEVSFPGIKGKIVSSIANGDCTCVFKYERKSKNTA